MIEFHAPTPADKAWVDELLARGNYRGCDYNFTNLYVWSRAYNQRIARVDDFLVTHVCGRLGCSYMYPAGSGDIAAVIRALEADAAEKGEPPLLVVCDEISDPHNLGAIIRTAYCAGAHGVVIPKRRSAGLTSVVAKTSAGAVSHMKVARVPNIPSLLKDLKKQGVWVFGTAANGTTGLYDADLKGAAAIVIGSEGDGMTRLAAENCDFLVSIPMKGDLNSLNASASAAILLYEAVRQRMN